MDVRDDPEIGEVRRCTTCREWWPNDDEFFYAVPAGSHPVKQCRACIAERKAKRPTPLRPRTHGSELDIIAKRKRDCERKAALRRDPILGDKLRERQRMTQRRYYERNHDALLAARRAKYVEQVGHEPTPGVGRPRIAEARAA